VLHGPMAAFRGITSRPASFTVSEVFEDTCSGYLLPREEEDTRYLLKCNLLRFDMAMVMHE